MEPVTHLLTGACLARAGCNRKAAYATLAMTLAAEAPDLDVLWGVGGPVAAFQHHRGWTHSFVGLPIEGAVVLGLVWLFHRWRTRRGTAKKPAAPVRWGWLYLFVLLALLSHLLLDWSNNYGLRPFFPFNPRWYSGSFVFIFDPIMFLLLLIGLVAPALFGLINREVGARKPLFRGRGWAVAALLGVAALWSLRFHEHALALDMALNADYSNSQTNSQTTAPTQVLRTYASPMPANPFRWATIAETPAFYQLGTADTLTGRFSSDPESDIFYKPASSGVVLAAKRSWLGRVYLDWSQYPLVTEAGTDADGITEVIFRDLRFEYDTGLIQGKKERHLSGSVFVNAQRRVVRMEMEGRVQH